MASAGDDHDCSNGAATAAYFGSTVRIYSPPSPLAPAVLQLLWAGRMSTEDFTEEQKHYLAGFAAAIDLPLTFGSMPTFAATLGLATGAPKPACDESPDQSIHLRAQDRFLSEGKKLSAEEQAKRKQNGLD